MAGIKKMRITVDLNGGEYRELCALVPRTGAPTKAAVIRQAVTLLRVLVDEQLKGAEILVRAGSKERTVFPLATGGTILSPPRPATARTTHG